MPRSSKNDPYGSEKDFEIQSQTPVANVLLIEVNAILEGWIPARRNLPKPRQTRRNIKPAKVFQGVLGELAAGWRSGPNEAHFTFEDIPKLRQFINTELPEIFADTRKPWISGNLEQDSIAFVQVLKRFL